LREVVAQIRRQAGGFHILIVDDNPENLDILRARLARHGYEIVTASDGEEALATARETQPDLILLDIILPGMDGLEATRQIKKA
jgi:twitching motility two-component system response regulator PilH